MIFVRDQGPDPNPANTLLCHPEANHLLLLRGSEDEDAIRAPEEPEEVPHYDTAQGGLHSGTEIGCDEEARPPSPGEPIRSPGIMLPATANIVHDIHAAGHQAKTTREVGADRRVSEIRHQEADKEKRRHPTP